MPISDYIGWPRALNGVGDDKVLFGAGEKPPFKQIVQDCLAGTSTQPACSQPWLLSLSLNKLTPAVQRSP